MPSPPLIITQEFKGMAEIFKDFSPPAIDMLALQGLIKSVVESCRPPAPSPPPPPPAAGILMNLEDIMRMMSRR